MSYGVQSCDTRRKRYCIFGCDKTLDSYMHRFPHPEKQAHRFAMWLNIVCDNLPVNSPLIMKFVNDEPLMTYKTKRVCDFHFKPEEKTTGHRIVWSAVPSLNLQGVKASECLSMLSEHNYCSTMIDVSHKLEAPITNTKTDRLNIDTSGHLDIATEDRETVPLDVDTSSFSMYSDEDASSKSYKMEVENKQLPEVHSDVLHDGYSCNECGGPLRGFRYTCVQCVDYDLCAACEASGAHALHYVLRVPADRPYAEIQSILEALREKIPDENLALPADITANLSNDDIIKLEPEEFDPTTPAPAHAARLPPQPVPDPAERSPPVPDPPDERIYKTSIEDMTAVPDHQVQAVAAIYNVPSVHDDDVTPKARLKSPTKKCSIFQKYREILQNTVDPLIIVENPSDIRQCVSLGRAKWRPKPMSKTVHVISRHESVPKKRNGATRITHVITKKDFICTIAELKEGKNLAIKARYVVRLAHQFQRNQTQTIGTRNKVDSSLHA